MTGLNHQPATRVWNGIETSEPPAYATDYPRLLAMAKEMLQSRRDHFPAQIAAGSLDRTVADLEILAFERLVQTWQFIATGKGEPADHGADHVLRDALDAAIGRIADHAQTIGGLTKTLGVKVQAVIALRWHLEPGRKTIALARLTQQLRADAMARAESTNRKAAA